MSSCELQKRWQSDNYKNYLKVIEALNYLRDGLGPFSEHVMLDFQSEILIKNNVEPRECTTCSSKHIKKGKLQLECSNNCSKLLKDILNEHKSGKNPMAVYWKNSQIHKWSVDAWEIAKLYMGRGQSEDNNGPRTSDSAAILQLLSNCKRYQIFIPCGEVDKVINKRNEAMHSPTLSFTLDQLQDSLTVMMDFLRKILISLPAEKGYDSIKKEMEKTIDILKELMKTEFEIFLKSNEKSPCEEETKILQQIINNHENRLNSIEELTDKDRAEVFKVVIPLLEMIKQNSDLMAKLEYGYQTLYSLSQLEERINATDSRVTDVEEDVANLRKEVRSSASKSPDKTKSQGDDKTITVFCNDRSNIQFGNYNTMNISEPRCSGKKPDSGQPLAPSSSSACYSNGPAATGVSASKAPVKIIVPDELVDQEVNLMVAQNLGKEWKLLARQLGFQDSNIDCFDVHHLGIEEAAYQMLRDWRERRGPEAKMEVLAKALVAVKRHDIALNLNQPRSKT